MMIGVATLFPFFAEASVPTTGTSFGTRSLWLALILLIAGIFYTIEKSGNMWRFFDARTYRSGPFDQEYLVHLMEQLL